MKKVIKYKNNGAFVVRTLRTNKLRSGLPFMIHVKELSSKQCYYEFPDGKIELVTISANNDISTLKVLSKTEALNLRKKLNFELVV